MLPIVEAFHLLAHLIQNPPYTVFYHPLFFDEETRGIKNLNNFACGQTVLGYVLLEGTGYSKIHTTTPRMGFTPYCSLANCFPKPAKFYQALTKLTKPFLNHL